MSEHVWRLIVKGASMGSNQSQSRIMYHETNFDQSQSIKETHPNLKRDRLIHLSIILQEMTTTKLTRAKVMRPEAEMTSPENEDTSN